MADDARAHATGVKRELVELSRVDCLALLSSRGFGRLAVSGSGPTPIIRPVNYLFDERSQGVVFRTAAGSKLHFLARGTRAAFEVDEVDEASKTGWSVIIAGNTEEVTNRTELRHLESLTLDTWAPGELSRWVRIRAATISGRRLIAKEQSID